MTTLDETMHALEDERRRERTAVLQAGPVEVLRTIRNGPDVAEIVRQGDGSVWAVSRAEARDGRTFERRLLLAPPPPPQLTYEQARRQALAAEIAAGPLGPKIAERFLRGEVEMSDHQRPAPRVVESTPPADHGYNPFDEDAARAKALAEAFTARRPVDDRPAPDPLADVRERADLLADEAARAWAAML